jgi:predicted ATPase
MKRTTRPSVSEGFKSIAARERDRIGDPAHHRDSLPIMPSRRRDRPRPDCCRIVLTGGPGGGKTTAADLFRREIGERVVIVPEAATILFQGGFPRSREVHALRLAQSTIFHVQQNLEDVQAALFPGRTLLCDRGTVDGAAYWPGTPDEYFAAVGTTLEAELRRYDAVIFFETAAIAGYSIEGGNPVRNESLAEAVELDARLRALWSPHPRFILVRHNPSFFKKISFGLAALESIVAQLTSCATRVPAQPSTIKRKRKGSR